MLLQAVLEAEEEEEESPSLPTSSPRVVGACPTNSMLIVLTFETLEIDLDLNSALPPDVVRVSASQDDVLALTPSLFAVLTFAEVVVVPPATSGPPPPDSPPDPPRSAAW